MRRLLHDLKENIKANVGNDHCKVCAKTIAVHDGTATCLSCSHQTGGGELHIAAPQRDMPPSRGGGFLMAHPRRLVPDHDARSFQRVAASGLGIGAAYSTTSPIVGTNMSAIEAKQAAINQHHNILNGGNHNDYFGEVIDQQQQHQHQHQHHPQPDRKYSATPPRTAPTARSKSNHQQQHSGGSTVSNLASTFGFLPPKKQQRRRNSSSSKGSKSANRRSALGKSHAGSLHLERGTNGRIYASAGQRTHVLVRPSPQKQQ
jgi:hypothetical protein